MEDTLISHNDIYTRIAELAPYEHAETWDPTGPTLGWFNDQTSGVVVSLDLTNEALQIAKDNHCNLIITHHPFLFSPIHKMMADNVEEKLLLSLASEKITCFSCHTNLDAAEQGVAVTMFKQSLGDISYEKNIEILQPNLEEPNIGHGRILKLTEKMKLSSLLKAIENNLSTVIQVNTDQNDFVEKIAFTPGAFDEEWIATLVKKEIDLLVTGEIKHHVSVMLKERNIALFAAGHGASEQTIVPYLVDQLKTSFPNIPFVENPGIVYNCLRSE